MTTQAAERAMSVEDEISQREVRRLVGMSEEDQAWEQDGLRRSRTNQDGVIPEDLCRQG